MGTHLTTSCTSGLLVSTIRRVVKLAPLCCKLFFFKNIYQMVSGNVLCFVTLRFSRSTV